MKVAIIDMGTNTFHLLIVSIDDEGKYEVLHKIKTAVRLGKNGMSDATILPVSFWRGIATAKKFKKVIQTYQVDKIVAFGTSAIRNAKNGADFIREMYSHTGITINSISGDKEAELIYHGVKQAINLPHEKYLIMDIGGGSVEFVIADQKHIYWKRSYETGAARILEQFKPGDPIHENTVQSIESYLFSTYADLITAVNLHEVKTLVGSSGSFDTFADLVVTTFENKGRISDRVLNYQIDLHKYQLIHQTLLDSTSQQRKKMKGMLAMRVDMIVVASIMVNMIIKKAHVQNMWLSTYALKEGVLWEILNHRL